MYILRRLIDWQGTFIQSPIHYVRGNAFYGLIRLRKLRIESQLLRTPPSLEFIKHSLVTVTFVNCPIQPVKDYFSCCPELQEMHMINNRLEAMTWDFYKLSGMIRYIQIYANSISSLSPLEEISFTNLRQLSLYDNRITAIRGEFLKFPVLRHLRISKHLLVNIGDPSAFNWRENLPPDEITKLDLSLSPWHCNGSMEWLTEGIYDQDTAGEYISYRRFPSRIVISPVHTMVCNYPPVLIGKRILTSDMARNVTLQGNPLLGKLPRKFDDIAHYDNMMDMVMAID